MSRYNKRTRISRIALACLTALAATPAVYANQAANDVSNNATVYDTLYHKIVYDTNGDYQSSEILFRGYLGSIAHKSHIYQNISNATIHGPLSTYYLGHSTTNNVINIADSYIKGMITSNCLTSDSCADRTFSKDFTPITLNISNTTIDDAYERYNVVHKGQVKNFTDIAALGTAITLNQMANVNISNNSHIAGLTFTQGYDLAGTKDAPHNFNVNVKVEDSVVTSGAWNRLENQGFYGRSGLPSDYNKYSTSDARYLDDAALYVSSSDTAYNAMKTNAYFSNSSINGNVVFHSKFHKGYHKGGIDSNGDGVKDTNGWNHTDTLELIIDNKSKWVGGASSQVDHDVELYDVKENSRWPYQYNANYKIKDGQKWVYQSGIFNITLDNQSEWDVAGDSNFDKLTVNNKSVVNLRDVSLLADEINLHNRSFFDVANGEVRSDEINVTSGSKLVLGGKDGTLHGNTITVTNHGEFDLGQGNFTARNLIVKDEGIFNVASRDYAFTGDMNNRAHIADSGERAGIIAINSDGLLKVNGKVNGIYRVRIDNATGAGRIADYENKEIIRTYGGTSGFHAHNWADLGAYQYKAQQNGDVVTLVKGGLTSTANAVFSIPSASANTWFLEQENVTNRQANTRLDKGKDEGGVWVNYYGGKFKTKNDRFVNYDQNVHGVAVGADKVIALNNDVKLLVGGAAGFSKSRIDMRNGKADQDSQTARIYSSLLFTNHVFVDGTLSYGRHNSDLESIMSDRTIATGKTKTGAWGFGLKAGYDFEFQPNAVLTPYASVSGVFLSNNSYRVNNGLHVNKQSHDALRYELGADVSYAINTGANSTFTPYFKLAYVYNDADNHVTINGDRLKHDLDGSAVRVGLGGSFNVNKKFSLYSDVNYHGGSDVRQPWSANVGVKYHF